MTGMTKQAALEILRGAERKEPSLEESLDEARRLTSETGRKHVVRTSSGRYFAVPLYAPGAEGRRHDAGFTSIGQLVEESL
jgi:hypothetical protein